MFKFIKKYYSKSVGRIMKRLFKVLLAITLLYQVIATIGFIGLVLAYLELSGFTNFSGIHSINPDDIVTRDWIVQNGGFAEREYHVSNITYVGFRGNKNIKGEDILRLKTLSKLRRLDMSYSNITDEAIPFINELSTLKELNLSGTKITDEGLLKLDLQGLSKLTMNYTGITPAGKKKFYHKFGVEGKFPKLNDISMEGTPWDDGVEYCP
jgi:hypothetical protein